MLSLLLILLVACGGGSGSRPSSPTPCPLPDGLEARIRQAFAPGGLAPGRVIAEGLGGSVTFTVIDAPGSAPRFEEVQVPGCAAHAVNQLFDELSRR